MISYAPFWRIIEQTGATSYTLEYKAGVSSSTFARIKNGESVSTNTIDALCKYFQCTVPDIIEYVPDPD